jgi:hypothetical protein
VDRLGEVHTLDGSGGVTPVAVPGAAAMYTAGDGQPSYVTPAGLSMSNVGAQQGFFPNNTVTAASLQNLAQGTIPGGDAAVGSIYETEVWGNGVWGSTAQTLQFAVILGGTTMTNLQLGNSFFTVSTIFRFHVTARAICQTTGATGTWSSLLFGEISAFGVNLLPTASGQATGAFTTCESTGTTTQDTTASNTIGLSCAWGATTGGPTITSQVAIFKRIA